MKINKTCLNDHESQLVAFSAIRELKQKQMAQTIAIITLSVISLISGLIYTKQ